MKERRQDLGRGCFFYLCVRKFEENLIYPTFLYLIRSVEILENTFYAVPLRDKKCHRLLAQLNILKCLPISEQREIEK